jgi:serine/threonine-protein kinase
VIAAPVAAPAATTLGRYELIEELGRGGMARVYLALASGIAGFRKLVVLKVMRHDLADQEGAVSMFLDEARLAARLSHPNVVQTLEVGEDDGRYFIAMEYLDGLPLTLLLGKTLLAPLALAVRIDLLCQMLDGLSYVHGFTDTDGTPLGLVHRDISPGNVFVTFDGSVKLLDFGVAKAVGLSSTTVAGTFKGKFGYAAPEQLRGDSDSRSDVFSAGLLAWEVLSYRRLGNHRTLEETIRCRIGGEDQELMRERGSRMPRELLEICRRAAALRDALRAYAVEHSLQVDTRDIRALLQERFAEDRSLTQRRLDRWLRNTSPSTRPAHGTSASHVSSTPQAFAEHAPSAPPARAKLPLRLIGLAVVTAAVLGVLAARLAQNKRAPVRSTSVSSLPVAAKPTPVDDALSRPELNRVEAVAEAAAIEAAPAPAVHVGANKARPNLRVSSRAPAAIGKPLFDLPVAGKVEATPSSGFARQPANTDSPPPIESANPYAY